MPHCSVLAAHRSRSFCFIPECLYCRHQVWLSSVTARRRKMADLLTASLQRSHCAHPPGLCCLHHTHCDPLPDYAHNTLHHPQCASPFLTMLSTHTPSPPLSSAPPPFLTILSQHPSTLTVLHSSWLCSPPPLFQTTPSSFLTPLYVTPSGDPIVHVAIKLFSLPSCV